MSFQTLGLPDHLLRSVQALGFETPTPIQARAIPLVMAGRDVAAEAQTGSGKTTAFALPIVSRLYSEPEPTGTQVLVLTPTRELAVQVAKTFTDLARFGSWPLSVLAVIGGTSVDDQIAGLAAGVHVVVATPGRLLDLMARGAIDLSQLKTLVLDEADRLLDAHFIEELSSVQAALPAERQTLLFSATLPQRVLSVSERLLSHPFTVRIDRTRLPVEGIEQRVYEVDREKRRPLMEHLIRTESWKQTLVFVGTRRASENLAKKLRISGFFAEALHGELEQGLRTRVLKRFKAGVLPILVATDLAARGIDIPRLGAVVNFDLPRSPAAYVHRIGRTGRAGQTGVAISFVNHETEEHLRVIEKHNQLRLPRQQLPGFELTGEPLERTKGAPAVKGKRKSKKDRLREKAAREKAAREQPE